MAKAKDKAGLSVSAGSSDTTVSLEEHNAALAAAKKGAAASHSLELDPRTVAWSDAVLGAGGTATVYAGRWRHTPGKPAVPVAVKVF